MFTFSLEFKTKSNVIFQGAPKKDNPVLDLYDCKGISPYKVEEIVKGSIWQVSYKMETFMMTRADDKQAMAILGNVPTLDEYQQKVELAAKEFGGEAPKVLEYDLQKAIKNYEKKSWTKDEIFDIPPFEVNMIVLKLNSGGLLLYAPVRVHKEVPELLSSWLETLGPVKWIVVASSAHTLCIPDVVKSFPKAKIIGSKWSEDKLKHCKAVGKFDYLATNDEDLNKVNEELKEEGIELFHVKGDIATNAIIGIVDKKVLLECDIVYGHNDGQGCLNLTKSELLKWHPKDYLSRLFKFRLLAKPNSPNGYLPNYRFWIMDPMSLGAMCYDQPKADGSDRKLMAESLRHVLKQPFTMAAGVHFQTMTREDFIGSVDKAWNWLDDGKSLI